MRMKAPSLGPLGRTGPHTQHDVVTALAPDAETVGQPSIEIPVFRRAPSVSLTRTSRIRSRRNR
jgi:hypothetical protein